MSVTPPARPHIPRWCNGSTPVFGTVRRGSNPRRGATPIPLRSVRSLFSFRSEGHTDFEVNLSPQWTPYGARCSVNGFHPFCFPLRRNSPVGQRSGVRLQPCGKGRHRRLRQPGWRRLQNRAWLGSTPAIASHRIRISGTDTCRRSCWASPSVKVHLTSESAELRTRVDGIDRKPTLVSGGRKSATGGCAPLRPIVPDGHGGAGVRAMHSDPIPP